MLEVGIQDLGFKTAALLCQSYKSAKCLAPCSLLWSSKLSGYYDAYIANVWFVFCMVSNGYCSNSIAGFVHCFFWLIMQCDWHRFVMLGVESSGMYRRLLETSVLHLRSYWIWDSICIHMDLAVWFLVLSKLSPNEILWSYQAEIVDKIAVASGHLILKLCWCHS